MQAARTYDEVIAVTATRRPRRPQPGWAMTAIRRAIGTLRYVNDELGRASEAIVRSARAPQAQPEASAYASGPGTPDESARTAANSPAHDAPAAARAGRAGQAGQAA
jgi:hypothetical protein